MVGETFSKILSPENPLNFGESMQDTDNVRNNSPSNSTEGSELILVDVPKLPQLLDINNIDGEVESNTGNSRIGKKDVPDHNDMKSAVRKDAGGFETNEKEETKKPKKSKQFIYSSIRFMRSKDIYS